MDNRISRRALLGAGLPVIGAGLPAADAKRLNVVVAGGHPDDPETGAGGAMARYAALGHNVISLYLTRGEAGIDGKRDRKSVV